MWVTAPYKQTKNQTYATTDITAGSCYREVRWNWKVSTNGQNPTFSHLSARLQLRKWQWPSSSRCAAGHRQGHPEKDSHFSKELAHAPENWIITYLQVLGIWDRFSSCHRQLQHFVFRRDTRILIPELAVLINAHANDVGRHELQKMKCALGRNSAERDGFAWCGRELRQSPRPPRLQWQVDIAQEGSHQCANKKKTAIPTVWLRRAKSQKLRCAKRQF